MKDCWPLFFSKITFGVLAATILIQAHVGSDA